MGCSGRTISAAGLAPGAIGILAELARKVDAEQASVALRLSRMIDAPNADDVVVAARENPDPYVRELAGALLAPE